MGWQIDIVVGLAVGGAAKAIEPLQTELVLGLADLAGEETDAIVAWREESFELDLLASYRLVELLEGVPVPVQVCLDLSIGWRFDG